MPKSRSWGCPGNANAAPLPLSGEFVQLKEVDAPGTAMPTAVSPFEFNYTCKTDYFAACSAYHHTDSGTA